MNGTILVVGREGQLARALVERAAAAARPLVALGRPGLDLRDARTIDEAFATVRPSLVVNAAAHTAVDKAETEPDIAYAINRDGVASLARTAIRHEVPVIHVSTDYVFDGDKATPYVEADPPAPTGVYGASKLAGEQALAAAGGRSVTMRTAWIYSPYGGNFVATMLRLGGERDRLRVVDDQHGNPTSALDLADAILEFIAASEAAGWPFAPGEVFHAAGSGETTWCGLAQETFSVSGAAGGPVCDVDAISSAEYPTPARRPSNSRLDCGKLQSVLGRPLPDWRVSLATTVRRILDGSRQPTSSG